MTIRTRACLAGLSLLALPLHQAAVAFDVEVQWLNDNDSSFYLVSFDPPSANIGPTGIGNPNPTISLEIGKRYRFNNPDGGNHPYTLIRGNPFFVSQLQQGFGSGSFESDPDVDWQDDTLTGNMTFTLTAALAESMRQGGATPQYVCIVHTNMMGNIQFAAASSPFEWPAGTETFENALLGESVDAALDQWVIVGGGASYTAEISDAPASQPGQVAGSTRWLTIDDSDAVNSNRVYPPTITTTENVETYSFSSHTNIQSIATGGIVLLVSQHTAAGFQNLGGLEITDAGVNVIILGTDDGGIGKAGASVTEPLYTYAEDVSLGQDRWVELGFEVDFPNNQIHGSVTGSDGTTQRSASVSGLDPQGGANLGTFRWCVRNNAPGSTSVISYDNLAFSGTATPPSAVEQWQDYR